MQESETKIEPKRFKNRNSFCIGINSLVNDFSYRIQYSYCAFDCEVLLCNMNIVIR